MKLSQIVAAYVAHRRGMGMRFHTEARVLRSFCRALGEVSMPEITADQVLAFLAGTGPLTRYWERKHCALSGLYRFALARGHVAQSPLPRTVPRPQQVFVPYIYSQAELRRLLEAVAAIDHPRCRIDPDTFRTILLLLYGAGLRISEALTLTVADVDLDARLLCIRESKFYKSRLVPIGDDLLRILSSYMARRGAQHVEPSSPLFVSRRGTPVTRQNAEMAFCRLRVRADVVCEAAGARHQPRLHDLRHAFAVHRLVSWYRDGADVQRLLPKLATYLGHVHIAGTQRYLTLTPELLRQASLRFERYAMEPSHE
ncbi:MAG: tyrosine-type recombinase/integrase [Acetobacteraceae bacterium]|nr:tyrosine-type recombinase/integrase [Acetobacteraceae bacterium]